MKIIKTIETGIGLIDVFREVKENGKLFINYGEYTVDPMNTEDMVPGDVFVAATNLQGQHGGGSARMAFDRLGLPWGFGEGLAENEIVYAFPTLEMGATGGGLVKITEERFLEAFITFKECALANPDKKFYMTKVGLGIAGWDIETVHKLFWDAGIPFECNNVVYPIDFEIPTEDVKNW